MNQKQKSKKKMEFSKRFLIALFINCAVIQIITFILMFKMVELSTFTAVLDFSPLNGIIAAIIGEVMGLICYFLKSAKENSEGGVTYLNAKHQLEQKESPNNNDEVMG